MPDLPGYLGIQGDYCWNVIKVDRFQRVGGSAPDSCMVELEVDLGAIRKGSADGLRNPPLPTLEFQILEPILKIFLSPLRSLLVGQGK